MDRWQPTKLHVITAVETLKLNKPLVFCKFSQCINGGVRMSTSKSTNNSRVVLVAFIATMCLFLSTISAVMINGVDITAESDVPALVEGPQLGTNGS